MHSTAQHSTAQHSTAQQNSINDIGESYNELPYPSSAFAYSQPIRLHAIAKLKGLNPPDVRTAKILEIGCSFGGNLLPFAIEFPNSQIVGIDLSEHQIEIGKQMMAEIGIENIHLFAGDISQVNFENIQFDYIICHGVFSWVPENVQNAILACIQQYLSPNGIAYISYNTYPGWHFKEKIRNLMLFDAKNKAKQDKLPHALELLKYSEKIIQRINIDDRSLFQKECEDILKSNHSYLYHEYLEKFNQPFYFSEFIEKINHYQLGYLADSDKPAIKAGNLFTNKEYDEICEYYQYNFEQIEQYIDFITNRSFRTSLISHQDNLVQLKSNQFNQEAISEIYFYDKFHYVKADSNTPFANWRGNTILKSTQITDEICQKINENPNAIQVKSLISQINHPKEEVIPLVDIILLNANYFSFYPNPVKKYTEKPHICEKYRKLIQFIYHNPNITKMTSCYYLGIKLEYFLIYLSNYLDGKNSIDDLVNIVDHSLKSGELKLNMELPPKTNKIKFIKDTILHALDELVKFGLFNHYE